MNMLAPDLVISPEEGRSFRPPIHLTPAGKRHALVIAIRVMIGAARLAGESDVQLRYILNSFSSGEIITEAEAKELHEWLAKSQTVAAEISA